MSEQHCDRGISGRWRTAAVAVWMLASLLAASLHAQEPPPESVDEGASPLRAVVRVSWELIDVLAADQLVANVPFQTQIDNGSVTGYVETKVDLTILPHRIALEEHEHDVFLVRAEGDAQGYFNATTGCFRISGPVSIPFWAEREVTFDGRYFGVGEATVDASVNTYFSSIRTRRNGPLGRMVARMAAPIIRSETGNTERNASPLARQYVADFIDRYTNQIASQLNEITPLERTLFRLFPEMQTWRMRILTDDKYLQVNYAPPQSPPVQLPEGAGDDTGIEIWIHTTPAEAKFLERLGQWEQTQKLLAKHLPEEGSEAGKLTSETTIKSFGPWLAILIGKVQNGQ